MVIVQEQQLNKKVETIKNRLGEINQQIKSLEGEREKLAREYMKLLSGIGKPLDWDDLIPENQPRNKTNHREHSRK